MYILYHFLLLCIYSSKISLCRASFKKASDGRGFEKNRSIIHFYMTILMCIWVTDIWVLSVVSGREWFNCCFINRVVNISTSNLPNASGDGYGLYEYLYYLYYFPAVNKLTFLKKELNIFYKVLFFCFSARLIVFSSFAQNKYRVRVWEIVTDFVSLENITGSKKILQQTT